MAATARPTISTGTIAAAAMIRPRRRGKNEMIEINKIYQGDVLEVLRGWPDEFIRFATGKRVTETGV